MRVLQMTTNFGIGGIERQLVDLANRLDPAKFEVELACLKPGGPLLEQLTRADPPVEFPISRLYGLATALQQLRFARHLRERRIQLVHAEGFYPDVFAVPAARLAFTPVVVATVRDLGHGRTRLQQWAQRTACRMADAVVVNADAVRQQLVSEGLRDDRLHVIYNGVDLSRFATARRNPTLLAALGLPQSGPLVAVVSRLAPAKGIEQFIDAAALVAARFPEAHFLIVGDGGPDAAGAACRATLERRAQEQRLNGRLVFAGFRLDVPELLALATVAVLPSLSEALSNALLESMASGAAVVATDVGGTAEVVEDGVNGRLVPPVDPAALAAAVCGLLERPDEAARLGEAGRRVVQQRFSVERMVRDTEQLYLGLLEGSARGAPLRRGALHAG